MTTFIIHNKKGIVKVDAETALLALDKYVKDTLCAKKIFGLTWSFYDNTISGLSLDNVDTINIAKKAKLINGCCTTSAYKITAISTVSACTEIDAT